MKIKKGIPLIDQHDKNYMYGGKFGGNFIPETLKKPIDDLTKLFAKLRKDKKFLKESLLPIIIYLFVLALNSFPLCPLRACLC